MNLLFNAKELKLPARASLWYMTTAAIGKGVGFLATPFFTRLMSSEEYGVFTLYITVLGISSVICSAVYSGSGVYRALQVYKDKSETLVRSFLVVTIVFSLAICILLFAFSAFSDFNFVLLIPLSLQLMCDGIVGIFLSRARFLYNYKTVCSISIISSVVPPVISIMLLRYDAVAAVRIYTLLFVSIVLALYALWRLLGRKNKESTENGRLDLVKYSVMQTLPMLPHSISGALSGQADKLIITALSGSIALAKYSVAHSLGSATSFLGVAVGSALNPWMIRRLKNGKIFEIRELLVPVFLFLCAGTLIPAILAPELLKILAPREYQDSLGAVLPITLSTLPSFLIATETVGLIFLGKSRYTATLSLITAVASLGFSILFTSIFGYFGAGLALLLSQGIGAAVGYKFLKKSSISGIFDLKRGCYAFALTIATGFCALLCSDNLALRILIMIVPTIMLLNLFFGYKSIVLENA